MFCFDALKSALEVWLPNYSFRVEILHCECFLVVDQVGGFADAVVVGAVEKYFVTTTRHRISDLKQENSFLALHERNSIENYLHELASVRIHDIWRKQGRLS